MNTISCHSRHGPVRLRSGLGILETLLAIFIGGLALAGAVLLYQSAHSKRLANETRQEIEMATAIVRRISSQTSKATITPQTLVYSKQFPQKYVKNGTLVTPYGGQIIFTYTASNGTALNFWMENLPRDACMDIAMMDWTMISRSLNVNWKLDSGGVAYTLAQASTDCQPGYVNQIGWNIML
ncbi:hypothetical protein AD929_03260 [Gluconobacter potus]|uniref:Type 4 secretion system PilS N-terminal domain-containing protein n=1 Tax=Gluconobacter potus TaxID=2724927 RepID=A0A149QYB7_9PROT|nr:type 4 pilus major pilin [Gluconobacter potus]KXV02310.1 hypothetical protein AD929_03260 [Gluconobacter potus]